MQLLELKQKTLIRCQEIIEERIHQQKGELDALQDAANNETKSSAGDKYESTRAMMHLEKEKIAAQFNASLKLRQLLSQIAPTPKKVTGLGTMIRTNKGYYFLSASFGEVQVDKEKVICLSLVSPLGKELGSCKVGDKVRFNQLSLEIKELV